MTTATMPLIGTLFWPDQGLSQDAASLRNGLVLDYGNTVSIRDRRDGIAKALSEVAQDSSGLDRAATGRPAIPASTYHYAIAFLSAVPSELELPVVSQDRDGDIYCEWDQGPRRVFSVAVGRDGTMHYAGLFGHKSVHGSEVLSETLPPPILDWMKLTAGPGHV